LPHSRMSHQRRVRRREASALGERVSARQWAGLVLGGAGVLLANRA
jgi:hypothetical protein